MPFDHKRDHRDNIKFSFQRAFIAIFRDATVIFLVIAIGNFLFNNEIVKALQSTLVQKALIIVAGIVVLYEIRYGRKLCISLDNMDTLLELEIRGDEKSLLMCDSLIRSTERWININKQKISIMTSLSPLPFTVLIIGFLIDKSKNDNLLWNQYTVLLIVVFLFYAIALYRSFDSYKQSEFQLEDVKDARERITISLEEKKSHQPNT